MLFNGHQLQILREARGLTREQLADRLAGLDTYVGVIELTAYERGSQTPTTEMLEAIADVLGVWPLALFVLPDSISLPRRVIRAVLDGLGRSDVSWATGYLEGAVSVLGYDYQRELRLDEALAILDEDMAKPPAGSETTEWPACDGYDESLDDGYPVVGGEIRSVGGLG